MSNYEDIEKLLRETAESPGVKDLLRQAEQTGDLSEDLLARYQAGMLSPEEEEHVGNLILLSPTAGLRLAELQEDIAVAAASVAPAPAWQSQLATRVRAFVESFKAPQQVLAYGGAAAALAIGIIGLSQVLDRPPQFGDSPLMAARSYSDVETMPWNETVSLVDTEWNLYIPQGAIDGVKWFVWQPVDGATSYRVRVLDSTGQELMTRTLEDSHFKAPRSLRSGVEPGKDYFWILEAVSEGRPFVRGVGRFTLPSEQQP